MGTVTFECKNGELRSLEGVYYIPTLRNNIISLGQHTEKGNRIAIKGDWLWVYDTQDILLMKVRKSPNRLYKILLNSPKDLCLLSKKEEMSSLWHNRLGHVNYHALSLMSKERMVEGMAKIVQTEEICSGCLISKQAPKKFPSKSQFLCGPILELIHGDLCGPILPETASGKRYFFLLVDDFSRYMWVYFLHNKSEALNAFKIFCSLVERGPSKKVRVLQTDRCGEFMSKEFNDYCGKTGIKRHFTAPYTPQQNGVIERRNRTVVEMSRSCLKDMKLPSFLWGEAVRHSIYLLNRFPTRALSGGTPYEAWNEKKPHIGYIRVFGCVAHIKIPSQQLKKLDDRSKQVIHLGKDPGTKAYRLLDPHTNKIHVSRDVMFEEDKALMWDELECTNDTCKEGFSVEGFPGPVESDEETEVNEEEDINSEGSETLDSPGDTQGGESSRTAASPSSELIQHSSYNLESENYDDSVEPKRSKKLFDIYNETEETQLEEELYLMGVKEPVNFKQAVKKKEWKEAMEREMNSIEENKTWRLTEPPKGKKIIGYAQEYGVDFDEIYAPVTRLETVRILLALAAKSEWQVHHLDVKTAFLNGEICEDVYVTQPEGFEINGKETMVYKLLKALYGLRQDPRAWYAKLNACLDQLGFQRCSSEHGVYTRTKGEEKLIVAVYVDDLLITGNNVEGIENFKLQMSQNFEMTDLGKLNYYLGIEVEQGDGCIKLSQTGYARKIIEKAGMMGCNPTKYPMDPKEQIDKDEGGKAVDVTQYKSTIGGLRYLVHTRLDIAYAVGIASRYMEKPTMVHQNAVKRILRYVQGTLHFGLVYSKSNGNNIVTGFADSDLAGNMDDRRSTGGMCFYLNESLVTWVSQKQRCVALSSCEAEFMAATAAACQAIWMRNVLSQITTEEVGPIVLYIDNKSAIDLAKNPVFHGRSKHIHVRYHFIRECVERGDVVLKHIASEYQKADILTKALTTVKFERMRSLLGIKDLQREQMDAWELWNSFRILCEHHSQLSIALDIFDSSITNPLSRQRPMMYQDPNVQYAPVQSRVTTNPVQQKITDSRMHMQQQYQHSGYLLPTQYYPQRHPQLQQPQFIHADSQYVQHLPMGGVPMQAYYRVYSSKQLQQYPVYYVPARQTQAYNMPVQQADYSEVAGTAPETTAQLYNGIYIFVLHIER
ncbi:hypothetical protein AgCh_026086 [Apium graveolens]